jgi:hypothetical protein
MSDVDVLNLEDGRDIYAIGDIHGDFRAMLICLRDCCKVIEKTSGKFDPNKEDKEIRTILEDVDFSKTCVDFENFVCDFGYRWIPKNNSVVVFLGDLIDNNRIKDVTKLPNEFPFEEVKLCLFLKDLKKQALFNGGLLINLLGNHDFINLFSFDGTNFDYGNEYIKLYTSKYGRSSEIGEYDRTRYFGVDVLGNELICSGWTGIFIQINDFIFTHAGFGKKIITLNDEGTSYMDIYDHSRFNLEQLKAYNKIIRRLVEFKTQFSLANAKIRTDILAILEDREIASLDIINDVNSSKPTENVYCSTIRKVFRDYDPTSPDEGRNLRIVVGHTVQATLIYNKLMYPKKSYKFSTFINQRRDPDNRVVVLSFPTEISEYKPLLGIYDSFTNLFGITMDCSMNDEKSAHAIYRLDVGMSAGFDLSPTQINKVKIQASKHSTDEKTKKNYEMLFYSSLIKTRSPQVLHIHINNFKHHDYTVEIIRSSIKNTLIHQSRDGSQVDFPKDLMVGFL